MGMYMEYIPENVYRTSGFYVYVYSHLWYYITRLAGEVESRVANKHQRRNVGAKRRVIVEILYLTDFILVEL